MAEYRFRNLWKTVVGCAIASITLAACGSATSSPAAKSTSSPKPVLGISMGFSGNTWNDTNIHEVKTAIAYLKNNAMVSSVKLANAENSVSTQVSQIQSMIYDHVSAIAIQPSSTSGLNGVIAQAERAHIPVLVFAEGPVTTKQPYELEFNFVGGQEKMVLNVLKLMHGRGNVLDIRGIAGSGADESFHLGTENALKQYPAVKVVDTVYGNWSQATSENAVKTALPGLPAIQGLVDQGGEAYGALQAFASDGRPVPAVSGGNRYAFLNWWNTEHAKNGFTTISTEVDPGIGAAAVYEDYLIATGHKVPQNANYKYLTITQSTLSQYLNGATKTWGVAFSNPSLSYVESNLSAWTCKTFTSCGWIG